MNDPKSQGDLNAQWMEYNDNLEDGHDKIHSEKIAVLEGKAAAKVFAYLSEVVATVCTLANTYYAIYGTFTNVISSFFEEATVNMPGIKYTGITEKQFEIDYHATLSSSGTGQTVTLGIFKNGVLVQGSMMSAFLKVASENAVISGTTVVSLEQNDEIQLVVMCVGTAGVTVTITTYTTTIREF